MVQFLVKRFIGLIFVLIGVTFITFILGYLAPGDPIIGLMGEHPNAVLHAQLKHEYGLDLPWFQQYFNYLGHLIQGNFGESFNFRGRAVLDILREGVTVSAELGFWGLILTFLVGIPLGILSALKANTWVDTTNMAMALTLYALPQFVLAVFVQVVIVQVDIHTGGTWPVAGWGNPWQYSFSDLAFKLAPILVLTASGFAYLTRLSRATMLEVLRQDYVRTARAKGLRERVVIYRHALRNALIPLVTIFGLSLGTIFVGIFFIEQIFNIPGIGQISLSSITTRDYPVIQATTVLGAICVVFGNLISDILYTVVDPRIKVQ